MNFIPAHRWHSHKCTNPQCLTQPVWSHPDTCAFGSLDVFNQSHSCPDCGQPQTHKYEGRDNANYVDMCSHDTVHRAKLEGILVI